jgi:hypothetical protein
MFAKHKNDLEVAPAKSVDLASYKVKYKKTEMYMYIHVIYAS